MSSTALRRPASARGKGLLASLARGNPFPPGHHPATLLPPSWFPSNTKTWSVLGVFPRHSSSIYAEISAVLFCRAMFHQCVDIESSQSLETPRAYGSKVDPSVKEELLQYKWHTTPCPPVSPQCNACTHARMHALTHSLTHSLMSRDLTLPPPGD